VFNNFQRWGNQQRSKDEIQAAVLRSRTDPLPVYEDQSASRITADLRRQLGPSRADDSVEATLEARVFLAFAQQFDREHQEISGNLGAYQDRVRHMLADINAEGNNPFKERLSGLEDRQRDYADYMLPERVNAWLRLNDKTPADTGIFVTSNSNVLEYLSTRIPSLLPSREHSNILPKLHIISHSFRHLPNVPLQRCQRSKLEGFHCIDFLLHHPRRLFQREPVTKAQCQHILLIGS